MGIFAYWQLSIKLEWILVCIQGKLYCTGVLVALQVTALITNTAYKLYLSGQCGWRDAWRLGPAMI